MELLRAAIEDIINLEELRNVRDEDVSYVCSYCKKLMRGPKSMKYKSHGICKECLQRLFLDMDYEETPTE